MTSPDDWRIERLTLSNVRRFAHLELDLSSVTVLVGRNGSGKTAILDAIAVLLGPVIQELGGKDATSFLDRDVRQRAHDLASIREVATMDPVYPIVAEASGIVSGGEFTWSRQRKSATSRTTRGPESLRNHVRYLATMARDDEAGVWRLPVIAHYGVERLVGVRKAHGNIGASRFDAYAAALDPRSDLTRLSGFLDGLQRQVGDAAAFGRDVPRAAHAQFNAIDRACATILADTGWSEPRWNPVVGELTLTHRDHGSLPLSWLSTGTKIAAGLAIDLASRMARANPGLGDDLLSTTPGIVLIDEVDLHLHPEWQQRIVPLLRSTFPRVQFVLTTHSPQVLSTVDASDIRILEDGEVRRTPFAEGLRSDVVMREVQGTDARPQIGIRAELDRYLQLVFSGEGRTPSTRALRHRLEEKLGGSKNNEEFVEADAFMAMDDLDDDLGPNRPGSTES